MSLNELISRRLTYYYSRLRVHVCTKIRAALHIPDYNNDDWGLHPRAVLTAQGRSAAWLTGAPSDQDGPAPSYRKQAPPALFKIGIPIWGFVMKHKDDAGWPS